MQVQLYKLKQLSKLQTQMPAGCQAMGSTIVYGVVDEVRATMHPVRILPPSRARHCKSEKLHVFAPAPLHHCSTHPQAEALKLRRSLNLGEAIPRKQQQQR